MQNAPPLDSAVAVSREKPLRVIPWATWLHRVFVVLMYAFMLSPIVLVVWLSFFKDAILYFPPSGYTLSWYVKAWENPAFANGFIFSLQVSLVAAFIGVVLAVRQFLQQGLTVFGGAFADRFGPKPLILSGVLIRAFSFVVMGFATEPWMLLVSGVLAALGGAERSSAIRGDGRARVPVHPGAVRVRFPHASHEHGFPRSRPD